MNKHGWQFSLCLSEQMAYIDTFHAPSAKTQVSISSKEGISELREEEREEKLGWHLKLPTSLCPACVGQYMLKWPLIFWVDVGMTNNCPQVLSCGHEERWRRCWGSPGTEYHLEEDKTPEVVGWYTVDLGKGSLTMFTSPWMWFRFGTIYLMMARWLLLAWTKLLPWVGSRRNKGFRRTSQWKSLDWYNESGTSRGHLHLEVLGLIQRIRGLRMTLLSGSSWSGVFW